MTKKIFQSVLIACAAVMIACIFLFLGVLYNYYGDLQATQLEQELGMACVGVQQQGEGYLQALDDSGCRLTWIAADGTVLYDTTTEASQMENHAAREEISQALSTGFGESARYSATLTQQTRYFARLMEDGTVLRISDSRMTVWALALASIQPICVILAIALILSGLLAARLSRNIVQPLEAIDLDRPLEADTYEELAPLLGHLEQQHRQIRNQQQHLEDREREFRAVADNMTEGLVLLSARGTILSINHAALRFFGSTDACIGQDFITLDRSREIEDAIREAELDRRAERILSRGGREYQLGISRVEEGGVVLLIFDVTEKVFAERNRREFTANVSHELKTPLQSIMGSAELLENGLVRPEDTQVFLRRIREQSARLVRLIDDIIHLSQLDEKAELPVEKISLDDLAKQEIQSLSAAAEAQNITVSYDASPVCITAPRPLLHEILYNLLDNAIKYNVPGGKVFLEITRKGKNVALTVRDTGIGIPPEHQSRIFERFYRVDKSHSRQIGGTGLGLSIVKHAVLDLGGEISVQSAPGKGTTILVTLPVKE